MWWICSCASRARAAKITFAGAPSARGRTWWWWGFEWWMWAGDKYIGALFKLKLNKLLKLFLFKLNIGSRCTCLGLTLKWSTFTTRRFRSPQRHHNSSFHSLHCRWVPLLKTFLRNCFVERKSWKWQKNRKSKNCAKNYEKILENEKK